jgi:hypothetical protein
MSKNYDSEKGHFKNRSDTYLTKTSKKKKFKQLPTKTYEKHICPFRFLKTSLQHTKFYNNKKLPGELGAVLEDFEEEEEEEEEEEDFLLECASFCFFDPLLANFLATSGEAAAGAFFFFLADSTKKHKKHVKTKKNVNVN